MFTTNQLIKYTANRKKKKKKIKTPALMNSPQKKGTCIKLFTRSPKKPNSAVRKVAEVRLSNGSQISAYIPGEKHQLQEHAIVLIQGGRCKDLPGVQYRLIRGKYDFNGVKNRKQSRSQYGAKAKKNSFNLIE